MLSVLPLRVPVQQRTSETIDIQLSRWIDENQNQQQQQTEQFLHHATRSNGRYCVSKECQSDLRYLQHLRNRIGVALREGGFRTLVVGRPNDNEQQQQQPPHNNNYYYHHDDNKTPAVISDLREYTAILKDCAAKGMLPISDSDDPKGIVQFSWRFLTNEEWIVKNGNRSDNNGDHIIETCHNINWERANALWNLACFETYRAADMIQIMKREEDEYDRLQQQQQQEENTSSINRAEAANIDDLKRIGWNKVAKYLQDAAHIIRYLRTEVVMPLLHHNDLQQHHSSLILSPFFLDLWDRFCIAESQRAMYETYRIAAEPTPTITTTTMSSTVVATKTNQYLLLASIAAGAIPLYQYVEDMCQSPETERLLNTSLITSANARVTNADSNKSGILIDDNGVVGGGPVTTTPQYGVIPALKLDAIVMDWEDIVRAWGMWMNAVAEFHQAAVHRCLGQYGLELSRLEAALQFGSFCKEFCDNSADSDLLDDLALQVMPSIELIEERYEQAIHENKTLHQHEVPEHDDLPELTPQVRVSTPEYDSKEQQQQHTDDGSVANDDNQYTIEPTAMALQRLLPSSNRIMFISVIADPIQQKYVDLYKDVMNRTISLYEKNAAAETEQGRQILASHDLPHSLTLYKHLLQQRRSQTANDDGVNTANKKNMARDTNESSHNDSNSSILGESTGGGSRISSSSRGSAVRQNIVPTELWNKIEQYQLDRVDEGIQHGLLYIRQCSVDAMELYQQMHEMLEEDLQTDIRYKREREAESNNTSNNNNAVTEVGPAGSTSTGRGPSGSFRGGYAVPELQKPFRSALQNYLRLLETARDSDTLLQRKYDEVLDRDPKFRLLKLSEQQLQRIVLPIATLHQQQQQQKQKQLGGNDNMGHTASSASGKVDDNDHDDTTADNDDNEIDVTALSQSLASLSSLFCDRDNVIETMKEYVRKYDILSELQQVAHSINSTSGSEKDEEQVAQVIEAEYSRIVDSLCNNTTKFHETSIQQLQNMSKRQQELLDIITKENIIFVKAWQEDQVKYRKQLLKREQKKLDNLKQQRSKDGSTTGGNTSTTTTTSGGGGGGGGGTNETATSVVVKKISDALEEMKRFAEFVKQGQEFYNSIAPKMNQLQQQMNDVSSRLAADRAKYYDLQQQQQQGQGIVQRGVNTSTTTGTTTTGGMRPAPVPIINTPTSSNPSIHLSPHNSFSTNSTGTNREGYPPSSSVRNTIGNSNQLVGGSSHHNTNREQPGSSRLLQSGRGDSFYSITSSNNSQHNSNQGGSDRALGVGQYGPQQRSDPYGYGNNTSSGIVGYDRGTGGSGGYDRGGIVGSAYDRNSTTSNSSGGTGPLPPPSVHDRGSGGRMIPPRGNSNDGMVPFNNRVGGGGLSNSTGGNSVNIRSTGGAGGGGGGVYRDNMHNDDMIPPIRDQHHQRFQQPPMNSNNIPTSTGGSYDNHPDYNTRRDPVGSVTPRYPIGGGGGGGVYPRNVPPPQQQQSQVIDDEKYATLIAMDFPPDRVVAALRRNNNDIERALNDLLAS